METYLIYIAKSAVAAGAFFLVYLLLFQNRKHFVFNRIYLPGSLTLSFIIPLITFTTIKYIEPVSIAESNSFAFLPEATENTNWFGIVLSWYHYLFAVYILVAIGFLFHLLMGHSKAIKIVKKSWKQTLFETEVNVTKKDVHPFSFFNKIVLSNKTLEHPNLKMIVQHEKIHVKEKHTLDILFAEILFLLQWFNPFAWLIKDAIKNNLEYLTDHQIAKTFNPKAYQMAMVSLADKEGIAPFLTALNGSQLKNRIIMMKKKKENKYAFVKQLVVLPLLAILVMGLSNKEVKTEIKTSDFRNEIVKNEKVVTGKVTGGNGKAIAGAAILIKGKTVGTIADDGGNYKLQLEEEDETLVFVMQGFEKLEIDVNGETEINVKLIQSSSPLYIVDGKDMQSVEGISHDDIASVDVLKGETGTSLYGEKGKNGVVLITTKKSKDKITTASSVPPLYIVDGKEVDNLDEINSETIEEMRVLKDKSAFDKYGEKGKNGVIEIKLKPESIDTALKLRKFIAKRIKYPVEARENGIVGKISMAATFDKNGKIVKIDKSSPKYNNLDEVVVVANNPEKKPHVQNNDSEILRKEMIRIINLLPAIDLDNLKGNTVNIIINFTLQE